MASVPNLSGYPLTRWHFCIDFFMLKKPGNYNIDKLYIILLYEVDFNMMNKQVGRLMMRYGEANGVLAPEQYGSRKK